MEVIIYFGGLLVFLCVTFFVSEYIYKKWEGRNDKKNNPFDYDAFNKKNFGI